MKKAHAVIAIVVMLAVVVSAYVYVHTDNYTSQQFVPTTQGTATSSIATSSSTSSNLSYTNQQYHFSLQYPSNLKVKEYGGGGGALTVAFQDPTTREGFQVFVVPYNESQITQARFQLDDPSGVIENPTAIVVDGVNATMFYSTNDVMGDTREVWFIENGLLYEVTTYKQLDSWLAQMMSTWKFI